MFQFFFNDCSPKNASQPQLITQLEASLVQFDTIKKHYPSSVIGIITDRFPSELILNDSKVSLADCISKLGRELKIIAFSNFNKFSIGEHFLIDDADNLIEMEYAIIINSVPLNALNAKIVEENRGVLFTLPVHDDLRKDKLQIVDNKSTTYEVLNQYGENKNTNYIIDFIKSDLHNRIEGFEKLLSLVGKSSYSERFKRDFEGLTCETQSFLLKEIQHSINRNAITRFYPDDKLIKNVTPPKENKIQVFELRIFSPVAVRVYFYETTNTIYFGSIDGKSKKKSQTSDILNAASVIKELIALEA